MGSWKRWAMALTLGLMVLPAQADTPAAALKAYQEGLHLQQAHETEAAEKAYLQALKLAPELVSARYNLGVLYLHQQQAEAAEYQARKILEHWLVDADVYVLLGQALAAQGKTEAAQQQFARALNLQAQHPIKAWLQPLAPPEEKYPAPARAAYERGKRALDKGHDRQAQAAFQEALKQAPHWANAHYLLGLAQHSQPQLARQSLEKALQLAPQHLGANIVLARQLGHSPAAQRYWQGVLEQRPGTLEAYLALGQIALQQADGAAAENWLQQALQLEPQAAKTRVLLAQAALAQHKTPEALRYLEPLPADVLEAALLKADLLQNQGQAAAALALLKAARPTQDAHLQTALARYWFRQGNWQQCRQHLGQAFGQPKVPAVTYALRGELALQEKQPRQAMAYFKRAWELQPELRTLEHFLLAALQHDQAQQAVPLFKQAVKLFPKQAEHLTRISHKGAFT
ncbi:MAG: tetratricopeptide repeat protein [Candidatus Sericytochromatia bacterium]|nr:tetratricopeptide repeat protein [Candidatus Sericytochromatia bacterium]